MAANTKPTAGAGHDRYFELIKQFPLRPIRSDADLDNAIVVIDSLVHRLAELTPDEQDYLEVLSDLVEKYEAEEYPIGPVSDADMLRHLIEARETTQAKVALDTGIAESTISEILAGKRELNRRHIGILAHYFNISPNVFSFDSRNST
jgi:HTH-type transcriptional regulator / antitoxin HigA